MSTLTLPDGRTYGYEQWGDPDGLPLFWIHGTPGGRLSRHPDATLWRRLGLRVITVDRPGYGLSTPQPGRAVSHIAADVAAVADHLGVGRFAVNGVSGGGPHALAIAALLGDRVLACAAVCSMAPVEPDEVAAMLEINRTGYRIMAEQGRAGIAEFLVPWRERMLADPVAGLRAAQADSPEADHEWRSMSFVSEPWGFDPAAISGSVQFWHSDDDANCPLSATRRLVSSVPGARLTIWEGQGHTAPSRNAEQVLTELISAAQARTLAPS